MVNNDKHDKHLIVIINIGIQLCYYDIDYTLWRYQWHFG